MQRRENASFLRGIGNAKIVAWVGKRKERKMQAVKNARKYDC